MKLSTLVVLGLAAGAGYYLWRTWAAGGEGDGGDGGDGGVTFPPLPGSQGGGGATPGAGGGGSGGTLPPVTVLEFGRDAYKRRTCPVNYQFNIACPQFAWKRAKSGIQFETKATIPVACKNLLYPEGCIPV